MATLTLSVGASADDAAKDDLGYVDNATTFRFGAVSNAPPANFGQGFRFTGVALAATDTVTAANLSLTKDGATWTFVTARLAAIDEDSTAAFSSGSPPGARAIVSASIAAEQLNNSHADATRYDWPLSATPQGTLGAAIQAVLNRAGWASGNALGIVNNSAQDASAVQNFEREVYRDWDYDSGGAANVPQLVITYTAGAAPGGAPVGVQLTFGIARQRR